MALGRPSGTNDDDCDVELRKSQVLPLGGIAANPFFAAIEIDDGQLQSTSEGNALSPGENFMTGFIW